MERGAESPLRSVLSALKGAAADFSTDNALTMAGAVAFYTALSFGPLLILLIWFTSMLGGSLQESAIAEIERLIGPQAGEAVSLVVENADDQPQAGTLAGLISIGVLLFSASTVFAQLQQAMNRIWNVEPKPGEGVMSWVRSRLLSIGTVIAIGFLLLVSMLISAGLALLVPQEGAWNIIHLALSFVIFAALFALMFKLLPDVQINWRDVGIGSAITAGLFILGKFAIGRYLGMSSVGSAYGAAGSLVVLLVWVYYSSIIVFFGAEVAHQIAIRSGRTFRPAAHARWIDGSPDAKRFMKAG